MADLSNNLPLDSFPGFTTSGLVSDDVKAIAIAFNAEGVNALSGIPDESVQWAELGSRVTQANIEARIPVRLTALLGFEPFKGIRSYHQANTAAVVVRAQPWHTGLEWPIQFQQSGIAQLIDFYGLNDFPTDIVEHARAQRADLVASLLFSGFTNAVLGLTAKGLTLHQPGFDNGLPLFVDAASDMHFANPLDPNSKRFPNLFYGAGKITDTGVFGTMLTNMQKVPHPTKANMNLGLGVTHVFGPTHMRIPFQQVALQNLALQYATVSGTPLAVAATNIFQPEVMEKATQVIRAAGMTPVQFHIAPQLDAHPYLQKSGNSEKHLWFAASTNKKGGAYAELICQSKEFVPIVTLLGDGSEFAKIYRKIQLFADLDCGIAAGLPHFIQMYTEDTPA